MKDLVAKVTAPGNARLVYYGQLGKANVVDLLFGSDGKEQCVTWSTNNFRCSFIQLYFLFALNTSCIV